MVVEGHFRRKREAPLTVEGCRRTLSGPSLDLSPARTLPAGERPSIAVLVLGRYSTPIHAGQKLSAVLAAGLAAVAALRSALPVVGDYSGPRLRYLRTSMVPRPVTARMSQIVITAGTRVWLRPPLATMATSPVTAAPTPRPTHIASCLPNGETSASARVPRERAPSLASTRLSISAPIRSTKPSATAAS
jgi:hypothetical protein